MTGPTTGALGAATPAVVPGVPSPCINICRIHPGTGWCEGCLRTLDEITVWSRLGDAGKAAVLQQLCERRVLWARRLSSAATPAAPPAASSAASPAVDRDAP